jgi:hypothetical protein
LHAAIGYRSRAVVPALLLVIASIARAHAQPAAPRMQLVQEVRIDGEREQLSRIDPDFMEVGADGRMMIWQQQASQILVFDAAGRRVTTIGRRGQGPGEFGPTVGAGWVGDTLWAHDMVLRRFTLIGADNRVLRIMPHPTEIHERLPRDLSGGRSVISFFPTAIYSDGSILASATIQTPQSPGVAGGNETRFIVVSAAGELLRVVATPPDNSTHGVAAPLPSAPGATVLRGKVAMLPTVGTPTRAHSAIAPNGARIAFLETAITDNAGSTVTLTVLRPTGDTVFARHYPFARIPMSKAAEDTGINALNPVLRDAARAKMTGQYPPVAAVVLGADNAVWLQLHETADGVPCLLLDEHGEAVLRVVLPRRAELLQAARGVVWVSTLDQDDVPSVVRYRIAGPARD